MTSTDALLSQFDSAAAQAVDSSRLPTTRRSPDNLPLQQVSIEYLQPRKILLVFDHGKHPNS